jgi:hypothetical protein
LRLGEPAASPDRRRTDRCCLPAACPGQGASTTALEWSGSRADEARLVGNDHGLGAVTKAELGQQP